MSTEENLPEFLDEVSVGTNSRPLSEEEKERLDKARLDAKPRWIARSNGTTVVDPRWIAERVAGGFRVPADAEQFGLLREAAGIEIPADLPSWHPNEIADWMTLVEEDESISEADRRRAGWAVAYGLGIEPDEIWDQGGTWQDTTMSSN